ncbi:heavy metal transporter [Streptomyces sp. NBC_01014]|uniref:heavy metal transporter n=1 Tax=unclassified Streptomyces TaxID=2593676 RepID=UPI00386B00F6
MSRPSAAPRRGRLFRVTAAVAVLLALAGYVVVQYLNGGGGSGPPRCTAGSSDGTTYELSPEQAVNAATISAVGTSRGMPERAVTIALATALQESGLRNLDHGDLDSLGLFQQRPSQGWGTTKQIMDPVYSARKFYEHLDKVHDYAHLPLTVAAQRVQRSAFPEAYAKHEPDAALLASALTGRAPASFTCSATKSAVAGDPAKVRARLAREFGPGVLPAGRPAPSTDVRLPVHGTKAAAGGTAHRTGSGPGTGAGSGSGKQRGWELAHWAVANSAALGIERVSYGGRVWAAGTDETSWGKADTRSGGTAGQSPDEVRISLAK